MVAHEFDHLTQWASMSDADLASEAGSHKLDILRRIVVLIAPGEDIVVSNENFVELVRQMRARCHRGSRGLGEAIILAGKLAEDGDIEGARATYQRFIGNTTSEFHAQIARACIAKLEGGIRRPDQPEGN